MSIGFLRFIGVLLILGSVGFVTVKAVFTGGYRFLNAEYGRNADVATVDRR
ncbi:MAG: hypothetical protein KIT16_07885 [Rhodospirillaceae bacterium]|nr:hypothetical protein [Rhodospirillaceae bacterium]